MLEAAGGSRFAAYSPENASGTPIYVHAKVCVVDDTWACVGSDNANLRSWTHDSELSCAVLDGAGHESASWAGQLRTRLAREHLGAEVPDDDLRDPVSVFEAFLDSAVRLDSWHADGRPGPRPPGQLRRYQQPVLSAATRLWAGPMYRLLYDPDGRTRRRRREPAF